MTPVMRNPATSGEYKTRYVKNKCKKQVGTVYSSTCTAVFDSAQCLYTKYSAIQRYEIHNVLVARTVLHLGREGKATARFNKHSTAEFTKHTFLLHIMVVLNIY